LKNEIEKHPTEIELLRAELEKQKLKYAELLHKFQDIMDNTGIYGYVYDSENKPVEGISVFVVEKDSQQQQRVNTNPQGYYTVTQLPEGAYSIVCNLYPEDEISINISYGKLIRQDFGSRKGVRLFGYVYDKDYEPVQAKITLMSPTFAALRAESNKDGYYEFKNIKRVNYSVSLQPEPTAQRVVTDPVVIPENITEYQHDIVLNALTISGHIFDEVTKEPIQDVKVQTSYKKEGVFCVAFARSDISGYYELSYFQPGEYRVEFWPSGYSNKTLTVRLKEGKDVTDADIELTPVGPLWLLIKDQYGKPLGGNITYGASGPGTNIMAGPYPVEKGGLFSISNLNPGTYTIDLQTDGYEQFKKEITIPSEGYPKDAPYEIMMKKLE